MALCDFVIWGVKVPFHRVTNKVAAVNIKEIPSTGTSQMQNLCIFLYLRLSD